MFFSTLVSPQSGRSGRMLAAFIALGGLALALIALKFRVFTPQTIDPATTQPAQYGEPLP